MADAAAGFDAARPRRRRPALARRAAALCAAAALALALAVVPDTAAAAGGKCRVVGIQMTPTDGLQIVIWIEDASGNYVDTAFITASTGTYGLGNRPGMMTFNSAWHWPYGRRTTVFPVWAHRHGMAWPLVVFQDGIDTELSHPLGESSDESYYCRPLDPTNPSDKAEWDSQSCASPTFTDKGRFVTSADVSQVDDGGVPYSNAGLPFNDAGLPYSLYPPRADLPSAVDSADSADAARFAGMNPFDAVSQATPPGGRLFRANWAIPAGLPDGNYVAWVEVSKEFDQNQYYDYPAPTGIPWSYFGSPYRGQPSVVYRVPFALGAQASTTSVKDYDGYGDPDGFDGKIRPPDDTITTGVPGSGASRLLLTDVDGKLFRVRVLAKPISDHIAPGAIGEFQAVQVGSQAATLSFISPGNDGQSGTPAGYQIRYTAGTPLTQANFAHAVKAGVTVKPESAGTVESFTIPGLLPLTHYYVGVRAYDACLNYGPLSVVEVTTPRQAAGTVDACFVATAAYGSFLAGQVTMLRRFRDVALRTHVPGEMAVEAYYTIGPALARVIAPSRTLRRAARDFLAPLVGLAGRMVGGGSGSGAGSAR